MNTKLADVVGSENANENVSDKTTIPQYLLKCIQGGFKGKWHYISRAREV